MPNLSREPSAVGLLPYESTTFAQRAQAVTHTRELLLPLFPSLTDYELQTVFELQEPMLWVEEETQTAQVEGETLLRLANWIELNLNVGGLVKMSAIDYEVFNLKSLMLRYAREARQLLTSHPGLFKPEFSRVHELLHNLVNERLDAKRSQGAAMWPNEMPSGATTIILSGS